MTKEEMLKRYILIEYGSIRNFCKKTGISSSTMSTIFKRGLENMTIDKFLTICNELDISGDDLIEGRIVKRDKSKHWNKDLYSKMELVSDYTKSLIENIVDQDLEWNSPDTVLTSKRSKEIVKASKNSGIESDVYLAAASGLDENMTEEQKKTILEDIEKYK